MNDKPLVGIRFPWRRPRLPELSEEFVHNFWWYWFPAIVLIALAVIWAASADYARLKSMMPELP